MERIEQHVMLHSVASDNISVVIQGPLRRDLAPSAGIEACVASVRRHLPGAEIVVSTWQSENTQGLSNCRITKSDDPGSAGPFPPTGNNFNRMVLSTRTGIESATRDYVLKMRADVTLTGRNMCQIKHGAGRWMRRPITMCSMFVPDPLLMRVAPHPADTVLFGLREDMLDLWSAAHQRETHLCPEQILLLDWLERHGVQVELRRPDDMRPHVVRDLCRAITDDFALLDFARCGLLFLDALLRRGNAKTRMTEAEFDRIKHRLGSWRELPWLLLVYILTTKKVRRLAKICAGLTGPYATTRRTS